MANLPNPSSCPTSHSRDCSLHSPHLTLCPLAAQSLFQQLVAKPVISQCPSSRPFSSLLVKMYLFDTLTCVISVWYLPAVWYPDLRIFSSYSSYKEYLWNVAVSLLELQAEIFWEQRPPHTLKYLVESQPFYLNQVTTVTLHVLICRMELIIPFISITIDNTLTHIYLFGSQKPLSGGEGYFPAYRQGNWSSVRWSNLSWYNLWKG